MILTKHVFTFFLILVVAVAGSAQCISLSVNDLLLLNHTPNRPILEEFLYQRKFTFKEKKILDDRHVYQYISNELGLMIEYTEAILEDELFNTISVFIRQNSKDSFLKNLNDNGWMKYKEEFLDPHGWINQAFINPNLPGYSVIYGRTTDRGVKYFRVIL